MDKLFSTHLLMYSFRLRRQKRKAELAWTREGWRRRTGDGRADVLPLRTVRGKSQSGRAAASHRRG
ncbi:hypothetical protein, partial [Xanthomonas perforans]|uniref:hypothetical protein n=1 Tax=Xanthomonas perforans TaxID=442694 RepID=UPI0019D00864